MIRNRFGRRVLGALLMALGGVMLWAVASPVGGSLLIAAAIVLEIAGITLERRAKSD